MYEHHREPLLPYELFIGRLFRSFLLASGFIVLSLILGAAGYHFTERFSWLDSFLNAAMILGGMGPVDPLKTVAGKLFATFYALYSGIAFLTVAAILLAPVIHRFLHRFHLQEEGKRKFNGKNLMIGCLIAAAALALAGCNFNLNYLVPNARLTDVETGLKDYAGLSGYTITYADDATGAYRVVVGKAVLPAPSAVKHESRIIERQYAVLVIQMSQQGKDVFINAQSTGQVDASNQYRGFIDFLKGKGYAVQEIK